MMDSSRKVTVVHDTPAVRKVMDDVWAELGRLGDFEARRRGLLFLDRTKYPELRARIDRVLEEAEWEMERMVIGVHAGDWVEIGGHPFRVAGSGRKGFVQTERIDDDGYVVSSVPAWAEGLVPLAPDRVEELRQAERSGTEAPTLNRSARANLDVHKRLLGERHLE